MKDLSEPDRLLDLAQMLSKVLRRMTKISLTSTEKVRKHVEGIGMATLTALVGLQTLLHRIVNTHASKLGCEMTHLPMVVVYLSFLKPYQGIWAAQQT